MSCNEIRELFSDHLEDALAPAAERRVEAHLRRCKPCRLLHEELDALLADLPELAEPTPDALGERLAAGVSLPSRRVDWIAWRRAAAWALVFAGAWWQLGAGAVQSLAREVAPKAEDVIVEVRQRATRQAASGEGLIGRIGAMNDGLTELGLDVHGAIFGDEAPASGDVEPVGPNPDDAPAPASPPATDRLPASQVPANPVPAK